jgi:acetyl esterase/lipase
VKASFIFLLILFSISHLLQAQTDSLYLWPGEVPNEAKPKSAPIPSTLDDGSIRIIEVTNPFLAVFEPKPSRKNGKAIIVCPGGAYVRLAVHKEGYATADWLTDLGYSVFVLHYRVPDKRDGALQDLQRAIRLVRHRAKLYGIDPVKIGAMGFSAGAHVVARAGMEEPGQRYPAQDEADKSSPLPDRMIIIYPGYLSDGPNKSLSPELKAVANTPATFIFQTMDDGSALSAFALATALQRAKANVELHMLPVGGHGYGMYPGNKAAEAWPMLLEGWLKEHL